MEPRKKFWWQSEFQYLFDNKILTKDEMACLFGQIKSIIEREEAAHKAMWETFKDFLRNTAIPHFEPRELLAEMERLER